MLKFDWTQNRVLLVLGGVISFLLILPNLGKGWETFQYVARTPETAYAAKATADELDTQFDRYLTQQQAYTEALNKYIGQQQQPSPRGLQEWDAQGVCWTCLTTDRERCFEESLWTRCE